MHYCERGSGMKYVHFVTTLMCYFYVYGNNVGQVDHNYTLSSYTVPLGSGGAPKYPEYFQCTGSELRLSHCKSFNETAPKSSGYDVNLHCPSPHCAAICSDGEVRLVEGKTGWEGRVETCFNQRWGVVGGNGWTLTNSHVVCNSLGYDITGK